MSRGVRESTSGAPAAPDRAEALRAIERDVGLVLSGAGGAKAAAGRLLACINAGTAVENASILRDVLTAAGNSTVRAIYGGKGG